MALGLAVLAAAIAPAQPARAADPPKASPAAAPPAATPPAAAPPAAAPPAVAPEAEPPAATDAPLEGSSEPKKRPPPRYAPTPDWGAPEMQMPILPRRLDYEDGDPILPEYQLKTKADRGLMVSGLVTLLVPYGISALFGAAYLSDGGNDAEEGGPMIVPLAGPFITIATSDEDDEIAKYFLLLDGFAQLAGAAMITTSILFPDKYLERTAKLPGKPELLIGGTSAAVKLHF
ncbi:hypothetical protein [Polyangium aurulentum]|uniref:hypothetical protein n=1 Tax=Polyangium aurulentum TaxID=2567896 RepID=UPI00200F50BC|nr:hypothetical protein [Polyangium aurulentum]UQA63436.1 hypothetical protein E8A73_024370 [Polyangium aurulentum]